MADPASASDCAPAQIAGDVTSLPQVWRLALEALVAVTAREGQPWSCPEARITLVPPSDDAPAVLEVEDASGVRRRTVAFPADVVPLGEAMLARAFVLEVPGPLVTLGGDAPARQITLGGDAPYPPAAPLMKGTDRDSDRRRAAANVPPDPAVLVPIVSFPGHPPAASGLLVDVLTGVHFTGPTRALLVGPELRAGVVRGRWLGALLARYDSAVAFFQRVPDQFTLASATIGVAGGYSLVTAPIELNAAIQPTLAVALIGGQPPGQTEPEIDAKVDLRLGARLSAAIPVAGRFRAVCALGAEGTPAALLPNGQSHHHDLPLLPGYMVGMSVGVEIAAN